MPTSMGKRVARVLGVVFLVSAITVALLFGAEMLLGRAIPFSGPEWRQGDRRTRWRMAHDIHINAVLVGLSQESLEQTLGKPNNVLGVRHPPPDVVYLYWIDKPLDPFHWNLRIWIEGGVVSKVLIDD